MERLYTFLLISTFLEFKSTNIGAWSGGLLSYEGNIKAVMLLMPMMWSRKLTYECFDKQHDCLDVSFFG